MKLYTLILRFIKHPPIEIERRLLQEPSLYFVHEGVEFVRILFDAESQTAVYRERV